MRQTKEILCNLAVALVAGCGLLWLVDQGKTEEKPVAQCEYIEPQRVAATPKLQR